MLKLCSMQEHDSVGLYQQIKHKHNRQFFVRVVRRGIKLSPGMLNRKSGNYGNMEVTIDVQFPRFGWNMPGALKQVLKRDMTWSAFDGMEPGDDEIYG